MPDGEEKSRRSSAAGSSAKSPRSGAKSRSGAPSPTSKRIAWTPDLLWSALRTKDKRQVAAALGCGLSNVYAQLHKFRASSPGGSDPRHVVDRDVHRLMVTMLDGARVEVLAAVAFVSASPPPVFDHLLAAADRGVKVRLLFRADNLAGSLVQPLQRSGVDFRTLSDLHAKFLITDTTAMNGSANFTDASANRASEVATFFNEPSLVQDLRAVFDDYWKQARPY